MKDNKDEVIIYQPEGKLPKLSVTLSGETVWLSQSQLVELFDSSKANISEHISNILKDGELEKMATVRNFRTVQIEGGRILK